MLAGTTELCQVVLGSKVRRNLRDQGGTAALCAADVARAKMRLVAGAQMTEQGRPGRREGELGFN
jgi:hypothetical protein